MDRLAGLFKRSSESGDRSCRGVGGEAVPGVGGEGEDGVDDADLEDGRKNRKNQKIYDNIAIPSVSWNVFRHEGVTEDLDSIGNFSSSTAFTDLVDIMSKHRIKYHSPHKPPGTESNFWNLVKWQFLFVSLLTLFWCLALFLYLSLVDPFEPRMIGRRSLATPGLAIRPQPINPYSSLISFRHGGSGDWEVLNSRIKEFIKGYSFGERIGASSVCNWNTTLTKDFRCHVANRKWMALDTDVPCTGAEKYGMYHGRPCVILKMNNIYGWEPKPYYNLTQINNLVGMPTWLKTTITNHYNKHCLPLPKKSRKKCPQMRMIWLSCEGETAADEEHMGKVHYVPWQGFPGYYYPYLNQQHYLSPIVFIQFRNITPGVLIQVRCKIWARNIQHDPTNPRKGGIHFEILMD